MGSNLFYIVATIAFYLIFVLLIGFYYAKKNESASDFYLGGRQLGPLVTAMSAEASDMSSWLLMGLPGVAYLSGSADVAWTSIGLAVGTYLNWLFVAKRLRIYTRITDSFTLPQFFSARFHDNRHILTAFAAAIIVIFFIPYTASGFAACGKLFNSLFGADYMTAMIISAIVIVSYTAAGGFLAASTTDFVQSIIMTFALLFVLGVLYFLCRIIFSSLKLFTGLPVIKFVDQFLGVGAGGLKAFMLLYVVDYILKIWLNL